MSGNIYGTLFRLATYGESHGPAIGGVIDGCPAGIKLDLDAIQNDLNRRKPGQSSIELREKNQMKSVFIQVFLKVRQLELLLDLLFTTQIKNLMTILT